MGLLKALWDWLASKKHGDTLPEKPILKAPPPPPIRKGTLEDIRDFCEEVRKTLRIYKRTCDKIATFLWTYKKIVDDLYVEVSNLKSKIETYLKSKGR